MREHGVNRREFFKTTSISAGVMAFSSLLAPAAETKMTGNPLPRWRGFNLIDFVAPKPNEQWVTTTEDDFKWIVDWGFDFVRLPIAYSRYIDFDRSRNATPADVYKINAREADKIQAFVHKAQRHGLHVSLNLHRAPGYCINAGFHEPYDLWNSKEAQKAFSFHWGMWAKNFKSMPKEKISFDLLNEPALRNNMDDQHAKSAAVPGDVYRTVAKGAVDAIRAVDPERIIIADGNQVGYLVTPELKDLKVAQSCRGYYPTQISHFKAPWVYKEPEKCTTPVWPGTMDGVQFDKTRLEKLLQPWVDLMKDGIGVHCGECGAYNKTPHSVFLAWFGDVLDVLTNHGVGYSLWNFRGDFGVLDSGRQDVDYKDWHGHKLDSKLLELLKRH